MKIRTLAVTVAVLAVLSLVAFLVNRPDAAPSADPRVGKALLDADTASRAASLRVSDKGSSVELRRDAEGTWRVTSYFNLPADFEKISRLVRDLNEAKLDRFVTANPERLAHMEFTDSSLALGDASGKEIWSVTFGRNSDNGNGRFVRFGKENASFFSSLHVWLDTDAKGWADTRLTDLKPDQVARVEIGFEGEPSVTASRATKDAPWAAAAAAGRKLSPEKVAAVVSTLGAIRFSDTAAADDPGAALAAKHARTFRLTTFDGKTLTITLARTPEEKKLKQPEPTPSPKPGEKAESKAPEPEFETKPAGPVYIQVASSEAHAPVNEAMKLRSFQVDDFTYSGLPQKPDELFDAEKAK